MIQFSISAARASSRAAEIGPRVLSSCAYSDTRYSSIQICRSSSSGIQRSSAPSSAASDRWRSDQPRSSRTMCGDSTPRAASALPAPLLGLQVARQLTQPLRRQRLQRVGIQQSLQMLATLRRRVGCRPGSRIVEHAAYRARLGEPKQRARGDLLQAGDAVARAPDRPRSRMPRACAAHRGRRSRPAEKPFAAASRSRPRLWHTEPAASSNEALPAIALPRSRACALSIRARQQRRAVPPAASRLGGRPFVAHLERLTSRPLRERRIHPHGALLRGQRHALRQGVDLEALPSEAWVRRVGMPLEFRSRGGGARRAAVPQAPRRARVPGRRRSRSVAGSNAPGRPRDRIAIAIPGCRASP